MHDIVLCAAEVSRASGILCIELVDDELSRDEKVRSMRLPRVGGADARA